MITYDTDEERIRAAMVDIAERTLTPAQCRAWVRTALLGETQASVGALYGVSPQAVGRSLHGDRSARGGLSVSLTPVRGGGAISKMADALSNDAEFCALVAEIRSPQKQQTRPQLDVVGWFSSATPQTFVGRAVELVIARLVDVKNTVSIDDLREQLDRTVLAEGLRQLKASGVVSISDGKTVTYMPAETESDEGTDV